MPEPQNNTDLSAAFKRLDDRLASLGRSTHGLKETILLTWFFVFVGVVVVLTVIGPDPDTIAAEAAREAVEELKKNDLPELRRLLEASQPE